MHVLFVEPSFPMNQARFVQALARVGAQVTGIGETSAGSLPQSVSEALDDYIQVGSVCDEDAMLKAVRAAQAKSWVDRLAGYIATPPDSAAAWAEYEKFIKDILAAVYAFLPGR